MGAEHYAGRPRPFERVNLSPDGVGGSGGRGYLAWYEQDIPHEQLVKTIRSLLPLEIERARERNRGEEPYNRISLHPFWQIRYMLWRASWGEFPDEEPSPKEKFFDELHLAWDGISYDHYPEGEDKQELERQFRSLIFSRGEDYPPFPLTLEDKRQVALLDAMAEAVGIPHQRGQREIPLPSSLR